MRFVVWLIALAVSAASSAFGDDLNISSLSAYSGETNILLQATGNIILSGTAGSLTLPDLPSGTTGLLSVLAGSNVTLQCSLSAGQGWSIFVQAVSILDLTGGSITVTDGSVTFQTDGMNPTTWNSPAAPGATITISGNGQGSISVITNGVSIPIGSGSSSNPGNTSGSIPGSGSNSNASSNSSSVSLPAPLTVVVVGNGQIWPNLSGQSLTLGKKYSLTALADSGQVFSNWSGDIISTKNPLTFVLKSNMTLQANFIANPFELWQGTYTGLFSPANIATEQTCGMLQGLTIRQKGILTAMPAPKGTYSGALLIDGERHSISGSFDLGGHATNRISRPPSDGGPLVVEMTLFTATNSEGQPSGNLSGTVSGKTNGIPWVANLTAYQGSNGFPSQDNIASAETMLIPPDADNGPPNSSPGGYGYALITSRSRGGAITTTITGALADGTAFSQSAPLSPSGYFPVYVNFYAPSHLINATECQDAALLETWRTTRGTPLYNPASSLLLGHRPSWVSPLLPPRGGAQFETAPSAINCNPITNQGLLTGWINLDLGNTNRGSLTWIRPPHKSGLYPKGFTNIIGNKIALSAWPLSPDGPPQNTFLSMTNLSVFDNVYDTTAAISESTSTPIKIRGASVSGTINPKTGAITVSIGSGANKVVGHGAILLNTTNGGGYFLTKTNAQAFTLTP